MLKEVSQFDNLYKYNFKFNCIYNQQSAVTQLIERSTISSIISVV